MYRDRGGVEKMKVRESFNSMFKIVDPNDKYKPAKIATFYHIIGQHLIKYPIKNNLGDIDMRFNFGLCVTSGLGKKAFSNVVEKSAKETNLKYCSITSLHEEQLIGKAWTVKNKEGEEKFKTVFGFFNKNFLIRDDALTLINSPKFEIARNYFLTALDIYGENTVTKKQVAEDSGLKYMPECSLLYFIQPSEKIETKNLSSGFFRRAPILRIELTDEEIDEIIDKRLVTEYIPEDSEWMKLLRNVRNVRIVKYNKIKKNILDKVNNVVKGYRSNYTLNKTLKITNQNNIIKFAYINNIIYKLSEGGIPGIPGIPNSIDVNVDIREEDADRAIEDFEKIYSAMQTFIRGNEKELTHPIDKEIVNLLTKEKCFSFDKSKYSSSDVLRIVSGQVGDSKENVKKRFYNLKKMGIIETKQMGSGKDTTSKVWLSN